MLNTNEVRARAADFAREWEGETYEKGEAQSFYNDFFYVFGMKRRQVASFEEPVKKLGGQHGFIDLFWKGVLLVEHKSAGRSLIAAKQQALDYFPNLKAEELPRYILLSDFQTFELYDLDGKSDPYQFTLQQLPEHVEAFNFIRGLERREFRDQDPVNVKASELVGALHDALERSKYVGHDLERFLVRLVFCLFADDTGIFEPRNLLLDYLQHRTNEDGSDTGSKLIELFDVLNTEEGDRQTSLDEDLAQFPYINGDLFAERLRPPSFDAGMRRLLIEACEFRWDAISPAIFGALFQSVMNAAERRRKGAHYTTELNILKLIGPLFLDELMAEFDGIKQRKSADRKSRLVTFHEKLARLTFFDPACGCGNFLIITYRELRRLENLVLKELYPNGQRVLDVKTFSKLDVDKFFGIEIEEFSARIAETAMWMMDHIMNNELSLTFGQSYARIPLKKSASILNADALEVDWAEVLPPKDCSYVFGNPPFGGQSYQSPEQRSQMKRLVGQGTGRGGSLDYVAAWFWKAGAYLASPNTHARLAFVATNSITQGEQVAQLWPTLFSKYALEISFAHRTFAWGSDAKGKAHVHVVILGLVKRDAEPDLKRLFSYDDVNGTPVESFHKTLSPYLFDAGGLSSRYSVVKDSKSPISHVPRMRMGSKIVDNGILIFDADQRKEFLLREPRAKPFLVPLVGSEEFINGIERWILKLQGANPADLRSMPLVMERIAAVRTYRLASAKANTRALAATPTEFEVTTIPDRPFLAVPKVSSEKRDYVPIGWLAPPTLPSQLVQVILDASEYEFGILTSRMHMTWLRYVGGRMKSDYQYSIGLVYNAFVWPSASDQQRKNICALACKVLEARTAHSPATLADLYDRDAMPTALRKAHAKLDDAVDAMYKRSGFQSDRERAEHLFSLYERHIAPLDAPAPRKKRSAKIK